MQIYIVDDEGEHRDLILQALARADVPATVEFVEPRDSETLQERIVGPAVVLLDERIGQFLLGSSLLVTKFANTWAWFVSMSNAYAVGARRQIDIVRHTGTPALEISKRQAGWANRCAEVIRPLMGREVRLDGEVAQIVPESGYDLYDRIFVFCPPHDFEALEQLPELLRPPQEWVERHIGDRPLIMAMFRGRWSVLQFKNSTSALFVMAKMRRFKHLRPKEIMNYGKLDVRPAKSAANFMREFMSDKDVGDIVQALIGERPRSSDRPPWPSTSALNTRVPHSLGPGLDEFIARMHLFVSTVSSQRKGVESDWSDYREWAARWDDLQGLGA